MAIGYFVTGTDTECGKTEITLGLMQLLQSQGYSVLGMKPIASGAELTAQGLRNEDAERIRSQASRPVDYELVNPFAYRPPVAPHLAAEQAARPIGFGPIRESYRRLADQADAVIVEGVGGWRVPLGDGLAVSDLARELSLPVILVVGLKLGCINHALLTAESIQACGLQLAGWVANTADPEMLEMDANVQTLRALIKAPMLGLVPRLKRPTAEAVAARLRL
jgi:dethiobiotin synthetase